MMRHPFALRIVKPANRYGYRVCRGERAFLAPNLATI